MNPGVVKEHIDRRELSLEARHRRLDRHRIGHVKGRGRHARTRHCCPQTHGRRIELRRITAVQHHGRAGLGEASRQSQPDALAGTGDERRAPGEIKERIIFSHGKNLAHFNPAHATSDQKQ